jgi:hypothetical protein
MTTTSEKILEKIKQQQICPEPLWKVKLRHLIFWAMFVLAIIVGALSFAVILETMVYHDWDIYFYLHKNLFEYVMISLPYVWILFLALFSWFAYYNFRHTKGWYRHRTYLVILASIFLGMALGVASFFLGFGRQLDKIFLNSVPYYLKVSLDKKGIWCHPANGLLEGKIVEIKNPQEFVVKSCNGRNINIEGSAVDIHGAEVENGEDVKVIGEEISPDVFVAKEVRDLDSPRVIKREAGKNIAPHKETCEVKSDDCDDENEKDDD